MSGPKYTIEVLNRLPQEFDAVAGEVAAGLAGLYGPDAGIAYRRSARQAMSGLLAHPACLVLGAFHGETLAGMLAGMMRDDLCEISFLHVRRAYHGCGVESRLIDEAVRFHRAGGAAGIVYECIPLCPLSVHDTFLELGFEHVPRELMWTDARALAERVGSGRPVVPLAVADWPEAAACIVDAYCGHPGRRLHYEVRDLHHTTSFLHRVAEGRYGRVLNGGLLGIHGDGECLGVAACCEVAPGVGFVLQLAVRRACQRQGLGHALLGAAATRFRDAGMGRVALGVTVADPARALYVRLGFARLRPVDAYLWWHPDAAVDAI